MRAVKRKRPLYREVEPPPVGIDLLIVADRVRYIGSVEHKDTPSFVARQPRPRPDASLCPRALAGQADLVNCWLCDAVRAGHAGRWEGDFPRYAWHVVGGVCYEARLVNAMLGEYKGYPLQPDEYPRGFDR